MFGSKRAWNHCKDAALMTLLGGQLTWRSHSLITDFMTGREDRGLHSFTTGRASPWRP